MLQATGDIGTDVVLVEGPRDRRSLRTGREIR